MVLKSAAEVAVCLLEERQFWSLCNTITKVPAPNEIIKILFMGRQGIDAFLPSSASTAAAEGKPGDRLYIEHSAPPREEGVSTRHFPAESRGHRAPELPAL